MKAELRDSLEFLYPDSKIDQRPCRNMSIDVARRGFISVHILLNALKVGANIRLSLLCRGKKVRQAKWFRLVDVPVEENTGTVNFTERSDNKKNRHVIRRAPFRVYDPMEPISSRYRALAPTMVFRLQLPLAADDRPGQRDYIIEVCSGQEKVEMKLKVMVHKAVIPPAGAKSFCYTNWFELQNIAKHHRVKMWSEAHWRMIRQYADLMVHGRQNTFMLGQHNIFKKTNQGQVLDQQRLHRLVKLFSQAGMHYIEGGHLATRNDWEDKRFVLGKKGILATSPEGDLAISHIGKQLMREITANNWQDRWIQHVADEPWGESCKDYRILAGIVRKYMPGIPLLDALMDPALSGSVDIWCPQIKDFQEQRAHFDSVRKVGDKVWFYTCCTPGGKWLNRLLDMELLRPALLGWGAALFRLDGFLHWGLNWHGDKPFDQSVVVRANSNNCFPAGDSHVVFPGKGGPWSSLRFEAHREGLEDYQLLHQLQAKNPRTADKITCRAIRAFDDYTRDVKVFRAARKALLKASEI